MHDPNELPEGVTVNAMGVYIVQPDAYVELASKATLADAHLADVERLTKALDRARDVDVATLAVACLKENYRTVVRQVGAFYRELDKLKIPQGTARLEEFQRTCDGVKKAMTSEPRHYPDVVASLDSMLGVVGTLMDSTSDKTEAAPHTALAILLGGVSCTLMSAGVIATVFAAPSDPNKVN